MFCEECGDKQPDNAVFCSSCGNKMGSIKSDNPVTKAVTPIPIQPKQVQVAPSPVMPQPVQRAAPIPVPPPVQRQVQQPAPVPVPQAAPVQRPTQQQVQQPVYQQAGVSRIDPLTAPLSVGSYMGMFILLAIPIVNFVMMCIWLFSSTTNKNKKNFAIAMVLITIIMIVLSFLLSGIIGAIIYPLLQDIQYNTI